MYVCLSAQEGQKSVQSLRTRVTGAVSCLMWILGSKLSSSDEAAIAFNHYVISTAPMFCFLVSKWKTG